MATKGPVGGGERGTSVKETRALIPSHSGEKREKKSANSYHSRKESCGGDNPQKKIKRQHRVEGPLRVQEEG